MANYRMLTDFANRHVHVGIIRSPVRAIVLPDPRFSHGSRADSGQLLRENTAGPIEYFETTLAAHEAVGEDDERDSAGKILC